MKKFLLLASFLIFFTSFSGKAQEIYLGKSSGAVRDSMKSFKYDLLGAGKTTDGESKYMAFSMDKNKEMALVFYFRINEDDCSMVTQIVSKLILPTVIADFNKNYIHVGKTLWHSPNNDFKVNIDIEPNKEDMTIIYTEIKN